MNKQQTTVFHEIQPNGQHRIVMYSGGVPTVGQWAEGHSLATLGQMYANTGEVDLLPVGVFTCRGAPHQQLV